MKFRELTGLFLLVLVIVGAILAYLLPRDTCLDSGGCWDSVDRKCRKEELYAQKLCDRKAGDSKPVQISQEHLSCINDLDCATIKTECSCDCGKGINRKYHDYYTALVSQYCFENPSNIKCKMLCHGKTLCIGGLCSYGAFQNKSAQKIKFKTNLTENDEKHLLE